MRVLYVNLSRAAGVLLIAALAAITLVAASPARALAACPADQPTYIGGQIYGYPDGRSLNALIGVDQFNAAGQKIDPSGVPCTADNSQCCAGYSWCDGTNPHIAPEGSTNQSLDRTWGRCVSRSAVKAFIEVYPKNQSGVTTKTRYGSAAHYYQPITVGATHDILLRLPARFEAAGGNTGGVHGYLTYQGHKIPKANITRVRAFTHGWGPECGVEGFSAAADELGSTSPVDGTWYRMGSLAAGRCGAPTQAYTVYVDCLCGGVTLRQSRQVEVTRGQDTAVDIEFAG